MDDKLANHLISEYEKGCEKLGIEIIDVKYGARATKLLVKVDGKEKEYSASVGGGTVLDSHVAVLREAYWEKKDPRPKIEKKPQVDEQSEEDEKPMTDKLTYKDIYKQ